MNIVMAIMAIVMTIKIVFTVIMVLEHVAFRIQLDFYAMAEL
jgi:hypothetical protein